MEEYIFIGVLSFFLGYFFKALDQKPEVHLNILVKDGDEKLVRVENVGFQAPLNSPRKSSSTSSSDD